MIEVHISGIHDLIAFVEIVRGKDCNIEEISKLTNIINSNSTLLEDAVKKEENVAEPSS